MRRRREWVREQMEVRAGLSVSIAAATHACARPRDNLHPAAARHTTAAAAHRHPVRERLQGQVHRHDLLHVHQHQLPAERVLGLAQRPVLRRRQVHRQPDAAPSPAADTATADTAASNTGNTTTD